MADCVCRAGPRRAAGVARRKLVVFFYGYVFEFGAIRNGPATSGHYALRRVLDCPDIDVLCSPISYFDRGLGQSAPAMTAAESVALAGKMWLYEDDTADLPGHRRTARRVRRAWTRWKKTERRTGAQHGPVRAAQFRHLVDGPGRDRLVQRSADVGRDGAARRRSTSRS